MSPIFYVFLLFILSSCQLVLDTDEIGYSIMPTDCIAKSTSIEQELSGELFIGQIIYHKKYWTISKIINQTNGIVLSGEINHKYTFTNGSVYVDDSLVLSGVYTWDCGRMLVFPNPYSSYPEQYQGVDEHIVVYHSNTSYILDCIQDNGDVIRFYLKYHLEGLF